jgi:hypothetical protein
MEILVAAALAASLLAACLLLLGRLASAARARRGRKIEGVDAAREGQRSCPLCASILGPGERVKSQLFPGKADRIMHIFGCVHCWPATPSAPRICPVCDRALDAEGWVVARYFERPASPGLGPGRKHIHVLGCTGCRGS